MNNTLNVELTIGNPPQKLNFTLEFYSTALWVVENKSNTSINGFNSSLSKTFKTIEKKRISTNNNFINRKTIAIYASDTIRIGNNINILLDKFKFFHASLFTSLKQNSNGVLGLDLNNVHFSSFAFTGFLQQLKYANVIEKETFYIKYSNDINGIVVIGETPNKRDYDGYIESNLINYRWNHNFDYIEFGDDHIIFPNIEVMYRIELGAIIGVRNYYYYIYNYFFNKYYKDACSFKNIGETYYKTFICDKAKINNKFKGLFPKLTFYIQNLTFELTPDDLFFEDPKDNTISFLIFFDIFQLTPSSINNNNEWIIGEPFLKRFIIFFDSDNKIIRLYYKKQSIFYNILVLIAVFCILLVIFLCTPFYLKKNKKKDKVKVKVKGLFPQSYLEGKEMLNKDEQL